MTGSSSFEDLRKRILARYPAYRFSWEIYTKLVLEMVHQRPRWLDIGAGSNIWIKEQPGAELAVGIDIEKPDPLALGEGEEYCLAGAEKLPFRNESFDFVTAHYVLEHLEFPREVFAEIERVLKPSGVLLLQTTNKTNPLVIIARMIPFFVKKSLFRALFKEIPAGIYKTFYRFNSPEKFDKRLGNLKLEYLGTVEDILTHKRILFEISFALARLLERPGLQKFKGNIIAVYRKGQAS